jgi:hypothetical protein
LIARRVLLLLMGVGARRRRVQGGGVRGEHPAGMAGAEADCFWWRAGGWWMGDGGAGAVPEAHLPQVERGESGGLDFSPAVDGWIGLDRVVSADGDAVE